VDLLRCHVLTVVYRPDTGNHCGSRRRWTRANHPDSSGYRYRRLQSGPD